MKKLIITTVGLNLLLLWVALTVFAGTSARADIRFTFDRSMPASLKNQIQGDLRFLGSIEGSGASALSEQVFGRGPISGSKYLKFLSSRISGFRVDLHPDSKLAVAYHRAGYTKLWVTPNYINNDIPQVMRITIFLHEARHGEKAHGYWSHANCPKPYLDGDGNEVTSILTGLPLSGEPACDTTAFGSYGIQGIALKNIQQFCQNCSEKVKMDAGIYGDNDIDSRIIDDDAKLLLTSDLGE